MDKYFYEVFENIPRQGPGMNSATRRAYNLIQTKLSKSPSILDIGCGKGIQTIELARLSHGNITAVDIRQNFLDCLILETERLRLSKLIKVQNADMNKLPFTKKSFDLIWAEGSVFIMGVKAGISEWKSFLKPNGFIALTDFVWLKDERPEELTDFWNSEGITILPVEEVTKHAEQLGYSNIGHFVLPREAWSEEYFGYQSTIINKLRLKYGKNEDAEIVYSRLEKEKEVVLKYLDIVNYAFFIFQLQ